MSKSQKQLILEHMQRGNSINKLLAFQLFNCMTLAQRIDNIEDEIEAGLLKGWKLERKLDPEHNNAMVYWLKPLGEPQMEMFT